MQQQSCVIMSATAHVLQGTRKNSEKYKAQEEAVLTAKDKEEEEKKSKVSSLVAQYEKIRSGEVSVPLGSKSVNVDKSVSSEDRYKQNAADAGSKPTRNQRDD